MQYYVVKFLQCAGFCEEVAGFVSKMKPVVVAFAWFLCLTVVSEQPLLISDRGG
jgi:hypothetical protein